MAMGGELCQSALQSLELLIIDNDKLLQPILLDQIIAITLHHPMDKHCALLVSKILGYYANNEEVCTYGIILLWFPKFLHPPMKTEV